MAPTTVDLDVPSLVKQLRTLNPSDLQDEAARKSLFEAARNVAFALETPEDTIQRITHTVCLAVVIITRIYMQTNMLIIMTLSSLFRQRRLESLAISTCLRS